MRKRVDETTVSRYNIDKGRKKMEVLEMRRNVMMRAHQIAKGLPEMKRKPPSLSSSSVT
jgi:hypothetical protein